MKRERTPDEMRASIQRLVSQGAGHEAGKVFWRLVFHGAGVRDLRGVSDAGMTDANLNALAAVAGEDLRAKICEHLDGPR